ncbi:MAG: L-aspartate oxidase, partial [Actinomycetes bacterium]
MRLFRVRPRTPAESPALPVRLPLPPSVRRQATDVVVVGSGAAGLMTAVALADAGRAVTVVTKGALGEGSTAWAQGGLAAVLGRDDDGDLHVDDTLVAGAGLCDEDAVRTLVEEAPAAVALLQRLGARLDLAPDGRPALTREGGHSRNRIVHAGGDASGAEVTRTLAGALRARGIEALEHTAALDALRTAGGRVVGLRVAQVAADGSLVEHGELRARAVVLATGGYGQVYAAASAPAGTTGDGLALALRAGADVADVEMVQFHPTVLWTGPGAEGQQTLISEAVRGEGAVLVDGSGRRIMVGAHPLADLAPRDVVSATIAAHLAATGESHVWLDATALGADYLAGRFPGILRACADAGFDLTREPVPVAPAAHYTCGGVLADLDGRTSVPGLFAVGEVACTGVHGANRLASNSVTEGP